jgi:hypothetical protein
VIDLPPGPSDLACSLEVLQPGPFSSQLTVFVDDDGLREFTVNVQGSGRAGGRVGQ